MVSDIPINMGYNNNPYIIMPLPTTREDGMTVSCSTPVENFPDEFMKNLNDIKIADADGNNVISLNELRNFKGKTEFAQSILDLMEQYAQKNTISNFQCMKNYLFKLNNF